MPPRKMFREKMMGRIGFAACFQCSFRCETSVAARKVTKTPTSCIPTSEVGASLPSPDSPPHARRIDFMIGAGWKGSPPLGVAKNVLAADLVVEQVEAKGGLRLRLAIELSL